MKLNLLVSAAVLASRVAGADEGVRIGVIPGALVSLANANSGTGYGGDLWAGYELRRGRFGLTPFGDIGFYEFPHTPGEQLLLAIPSFKLSYHWGEWIPAAIAGVGYARSWTHSTTPAITTSYVGLSIGAELARHVTDRLAIGIACHYEPLLSLSAPTTSSFLDIGVSATITL